MSRSDPLLLKVMAVCPTVQIDPVPAIVDTIVHECLHALRPDWSEATVKRQTRRMIQRLTPAQIQLIHRVYLTRAKSSGRSGG